MADVAEHYSNHLGPVYSWLVGGFEPALARGENELNSLNLPAAVDVTEDTAVDLGAGFGMHAIPLARRGYSVLAIDSCAFLLQELESKADASPIRTVCADLINFPQHLTGKARLILCMGDTICHLRDLNQIRDLIAHVANALEAGGTFVASFRDYTTALEGDNRFILVRSEDTRILTCFLEYSETHVMVHDLLHERTSAGWTLSRSSYPKVRLSPAWLIDILQQSGFSVVRQQGLSGMVRIVATLQIAAGDDPYEGTPSVAIPIH